MRPLALGPITITGRSEFAHWVVCGQGVCGKKGLSCGDQIATAALQVFAKPGAAFEVADHRGSQDSGCVGVVRPFQTLLTQSQVFQDIFQSL